MTGRRFHDGDRFEVTPMQYRVVPGRKAPGDLVLEWRWVTDWQPISMGHTFVHVDFFQENENVIYPPPAKGGGYFIRVVLTAARDGWRKACAELPLRPRWRDCGE